MRGTPDDSDVASLERHRDEQAGSASPERGLASTVVCTTGYRVADDKYATFKKVRFPNDQVVERIP